MTSAAYQPLSSSLLKRDASYCQPMQVLPQHVELGNSALDVMTDLRQVAAVTVHENAPIDIAHQRMIKRSVRLLLVVNDGFTIAGLLTSTDILGEKPMMYLQNHGVTRGDILVRNIMTPQSKLEVLDFSEVRNAKVGHIVETMKRSGRQHALVIERTDSIEAVRGIFSTTQIARQLGTEINHLAVASTFADIHRELS